MTVENSLAEETLHIINLVADSDAFNKFSLEQRAVRLHGDAFFLRDLDNADQYPNQSASHISVAFILFKLFENLLDKVLYDLIGAWACIWREAKMAVNEQGNWLVDNFRVLALESNFPYHHDVTKLRWINIDLKGAIVIFDY